MALSFPLAVADFAMRLAVLNSTCDLTESLVSSGQTGGGEILTADIGVRLWSGQVNLMSMLNDDAECVLSLLSTLRQSGRAFFVYDWRKPGPASDRSGAILGVATPSIKALNGDNREMTLQGLPAGYVLTGGDALAFAYGSNPTRYARHRIVTGGAADADGDVSIEVEPFIRPGAETGLAVTLLKAPCKAVIVPGSVKAGTATRRVTSGVSFSWQQTLR